MRGHCKRYRRNIADAPCEQMIAYSRDASLDKILELDKSYKVVPVMNLSLSERICRKVEMLLSNKNSNDI